jgi:hypothetical protein
MPVQATGIADVLIHSLNQLGRLKFTDLMSDYQSTIALKRIFKKKKATIESGPEVQFNAIVATNGSARHVGLGYVAQVDIPNVLATGKMPWRHTTWNWALERRLVAMNRGDAKIIDIAQSQRIASFGDAILLFERTLWRCPTSSEFDLHPVGIPYFVVKSSTAANDNTGGFNGSVPSGYTLVANIDPTASATSRYKNYADAYTDVSKDDLIMKMRRAQFFTDFMPLVDDIPTYNVGDDFGIYTNYAVSARMVEILESQNESLGSDVAPMEGKAVFMRSPIVPVKELNQDTTNPVYMLNWGEIGAMGLSGEWMREQHFAATQNQPTIMTNNTDCSWNLICRNRRRQAVISNGTTMPN